MEKIRINNGIVVTMDPNCRIISKGGIIIEGDNIIEVGDSNSISTYAADISIDASGKIIMPGLVNSHTHLFQIIAKGVGEDKALWDWGESVYAIPPLLTDDELYQVLLAGCVEMIRSGTTCCIDFERKGDLAAKAYEASGMRAVLARMFNDRAPDFYTEKQKEADLNIEKTGEIRKDLERLIGTYHNKCNGRIRVMPAPNLIYKCTEEILKESRDLATKYETGLTMHLNETKAEAHYSVTKHGVQEIEYAHNLGLLGSDTIVAHGVWATEKEMDILAKTKSTCAHCPESNMYLASGIAPIPEMMERGINVSLATDGPASNNNLDMFEAMRFAALLHKVSHLNPAAISSIDTLKMATINGARALNTAKRIGSLEKGKAADVVVVDMKRANTTPVYNPVSNLVYCSTGDNVDTVIIDGKILLRDRKFTCLDENEILERVQKTADRVKKISTINAMF